MSFARIMIHVDRGPASRGRIAVGEAVSDRFDASLIGIAAAQALVPTAGEPVGVLDPGIFEAAKHEAATAVAAAEALFRECVGLDRAVEWRASATGATAFVIEQSRAADILVVGHDVGLIGADLSLSASTGELLMGTGRPLLVVPRNPTGLSTHRVLVAWKNTREARRAVRDSLPFLEIAGEVVIAAVGRDAAAQGADDVAALLRAHGIVASTHLIEHPSRSPGEELLAFSKSEGIGLIVAGAYGHSRVREWIFGGVTRTLLEDAAVPCLLTH